jgi:hypothetical protein
MHLLAQTDNDAGLGDLGMAGFRSDLFRLFQEAERARVTSAGFGDAVEARNGFNVVRCPESRA